MNISDEQITTFATDGVVKVAGAVDAKQLSGVLELTERQLHSPGPWITDTGPGATNGRLFTSRYLWRDDPVMRSFVFESGVAAIAATLMQSDSVRFYFDHLLVKEPNTEALTPWHQDIPYWPFLGRQICSVWVSCTRSTVAESSLEFVRGSHLWGKYFAPVSFDDTPDWTADFEGEACPDIDADRSRFDIIGFDVEPGDAIVFSSWTLHGSPANAGPNRRVAISTRWLGDDATWAPHPGCDPAVGQEHTTAVPGRYPDDDDRFPVGWRR